MTLAVRATDSAGNSTVATMRVHPVDENRAPVAWLRLDEDQLVAGREVLVRVSGSDTDGSIASFTWDIDDDGEFDDGTGSSKWVQANAGTLRIAVRATDSEGKSTIVRASYRVGSRPPVANFVASKLVPEPGDTVTFTSTATDSDDTIVAQRWDLDDDGEFDDGTGATAERTFDAAGEQRIGLQVRDASGALGSLYRVVRVPSRTAPIAWFDASSEDVFVDETVTLTSTSTDPQGTEDIAAFEWDLDGDGEFDDATGPTATTRFDERGWHRVRLRVRDRAGEQSSARLDIYAATALVLPGNDRFADALPFGPDDPQRTGTTIGATAEAGEPAHAGSDAAHSVWFRYDATDTRTVTIGTCGSEFDTVLAVYRGSSPATLEPVKADDQSGCAGYGASKLSFDAVAGTTYWIALDGAFGESGRYRLALHQQPVVPGPFNDDRAAAFQLTSSAQLTDTNTRATKEAGEPEHAGNAGGHSVWYRLRPATTGAISLDTCTAGFNTLLAVYREGAGGALEPVIADDDGTSCAPGSRVIFTGAAGVDYFIAVDGRDGAQGYFTLRVRSAPTNDAFASAISLSATTTGSTFLASAEPGEPAHAGTSAAQSVWYTVTTTSRSTRVLSTCTNSTAPTRIAVYEGSDLATLTPVAQSSSVSTCADGRGARVSWRPPDNQTRTYRIAVDGVDADFTLDTQTAPYNDDRIDAGYISEFSTYGGTTAGATHEAGEPDHADAGGAASVWFAWQPSRTARAMVATCTTSTLGVDTIVAVYTMVSGTLTKVDAVDDTPGCGNGDHGRVEFDATANTVYYVAVDSRLAEAGSFTIRARQRPANDNRANALTVTSDAVTGSFDLATKEPGRGRPRRRAGRQLRLVPVDGAVDRPGHVRHLPELLERHRARGLRGGRHAGPRQRRHGELRQLRSGQPGDLRCGRGP